MAGAVAAGIRGLTLAMMQGPAWPSTRRLLLGACGFLMLLAAWEAAVAAGLIDVINASRPGLVLEDLWIGWTEDDFLTHTWVTLQEFLVGYLLSLVVGILLAVIMAMWRGSSTASTFFFGFSTMRRSLPFTPADYLAWARPAHGHRHLLSARGVSDHHQFT